ncbi:hypothetical protein CEH05_07115 [Halobacillus halophilus]|uniref:Uncharacterized protein n=1 Tax=Halobacillus halophilus (strain ATCC 35676 / DSM 2266 / JCM 20832 / KCTC 3685 / LMG 17431 / NBRC 102448 / NCIMB 2269) TaxID=866895 RepID=I0JKU4_HALH3|nr:hypothetical protein [Halobacillus halophilus]ASF38894.1 hypothetical protein CEH05_07115 [Halobacillus halophilus]CCG44764.1 hypothetical protein HBHAL_2419 [Halobacillus halophilus DSM 2266]
MDNFYSSTLENLEKTFMPYLSEYQRYIDFHTMREMKQVSKGKFPVYFDLDLKELVEMDKRYILDVLWNGVFFTVIIPKKSNMFRGTIEVYGKPPTMLLGRFEVEEDRTIFPTFFKEEFTRRKGLGDTLRDFSQVLYTYLDSYVEKRETSGEETTSEHPGEAILEGWEFPFLENHPDLQKEWSSLKKRTVNQFKRMEELEIEEQYSLETMMDKDVPDFIESFQRLSDENKENRKDELLDTMYDLRKFIETLEQKEEESHAQNFARSKGIIASKYNKEDENFFSRK